MPSQVVTGFLALPRSGERTLPALESKLDLLLLQTLLTLPAERVHKHVRAHTRLRVWLEAVAKSPARSALRAALRSVDVRAPLLAIRSGALPPYLALETAIPSLLTSFASELTGGQRVDDVLWDVPFSQLFDVAGERALSFDAPTQGIYFDGTAAELRTASGATLRLARGLEPELPEGVRLEHAYHRLREGELTRLALADGNPLSMLEEHPDKSGNRTDLGGSSVEAWQNALNEALGLIELTLPALRAEIGASLQCIVPVGFEPERHLSASYREAPGLVYMTLHPSALTLAEAIIHETQHGKLNVLRWFDPVLVNGDSTWTKSPVRPDLRPLAGVLLAVHAFVPVAAFHLRLAELDHPLTRTPAFVRRRDEVITANQRGLATLRELGQPTQIGAQVVDALEDLLRVVSAAAPPHDPNAVGELG